MSRWMLCSRSCQWHSVDLGFKPRQFGSRIKFISCRHSRKKESTFHYMFIGSDVKVVLQKEISFWSCNYIAQHSNIEKEMTHC